MLFEKILLKANLFAFGKNPVISTDRLIFFCQFANMNTFHVFVNLFRSGLFRGWRQYLRHSPVQRDCHHPAHIHVSRWFHRLTRYGTSTARSPTAIYCNSYSRVTDPDPDWMQIQSGQWIRIRIRNPDSDPGGQKWPTKVDKIFRSSCFEMLDGLFWDLKASSVTWTFFMEA